MSDLPATSSTFTVLSGSVCFGALHNIWHGASSPRLEGFPQINPPGRSGTVSVQGMQYNVPACKGTWKVYPLIDLQSQKRAGFLAAHEDVEPRAEVDRIIKAAPSPYESYDEQGSRWNDEASREAGIFLINRYDWGWTDSRSQEEFYGPGHDPGDDMSQLAVQNFGSAVGLVDYDHAQEIAESWKPLYNGQREDQPNGAWLFLHEHEYEFGRFAFNADKTAAQSFLFFSTYTNFTRTAFQGPGETPFRQAETGLERFERRLAQSFDYSGIAYIEKQASDFLYNNGSPDPIYTPPPDGELLGPYDTNQHILQPQDIDVLRVDRSPRPPFLSTGEINTEPNFFVDRPPHDFADQWRESTFDLINEMTLSFLQHWVLPCSAIKPTIPDAVDALFPAHLADGTKSLDAYCSQMMISPSINPVPDFDLVALRARVRQFLQSHSTETIDQEFINGITRVLSYLIAELLEMAAKGPTYDGQNKILPIDVRNTVLIDKELKEKLQFSRVLWKGR